METKTCNNCHTQVRETDYFCFNCGTSLKAAPKSTTVGAQAMLYLGSLLLPPMGFIWGFHYVSQTDKKAKTIGWIAIVITAVSLVLTAIAVSQLMGVVNTQVNSGVMNLLGN